MKAVLIGLALLLAGCGATVPVKPQPQVADLLVLPPRPEVPAEVTSQRQVAKYLVELDSYARQLEERLLAIRKRLGGE